VDWDWHLTVEIATLFVAVLILIRLMARPVDRGLPTRPQPEWRIIDGPVDGILRIEASNPGGATWGCCVVMRVGRALYAGNLVLGERQGWMPAMLQVIDSFNDTADVPYSLLCVSRDIIGQWLLMGPSSVREGLSVAEVPFAVMRLLRKFTDRQYACEVSNTGLVTILPSQTAPAAETAPARG
jgi:hypothetical protein